MIVKTLWYEFSLTDATTSDVVHSEALLQDFVISLLVRVAAVALLQIVSKPTLQIRDYKFQFVIL
ncbi:hypothetical protein ES703_59960 [subsurface metagenome]